MMNYYNHTDSKYSGGNYDSTDYQSLDVNGYGSSSCPKCGSTDVCRSSSENICNHCGNRWS